MGSTKVICPMCRGRKGPKKIPYGAKRAIAWCDKCDACLCPPLPNKSRERNKGKKEIKEALKGKK
jgi:hypothetical protein